MPQARNISTVSEKKTGNTKCNCQRATKHSGKHSRRNQMACPYLSFLSVSFIKQTNRQTKSLHNFYFFFSPLTSVSTYHSKCNQYSGLATRIQCISDSPKKEWEHRSGIPSVCNILSFICWLIGSIRSHLFTCIMASCLIWNFHFAGCQPQVSGESSYLAFRFHDRPGTKSFDSCITLIYLPECMYFPDFIIANEVWMAVDLDN